MAARLAVYRDCSVAPVALSSAGHLTGRASRPAPSPPPSGQPLMPSRRAARVLHPGSRQSRLGGLRAFFTRAASELRAFSAFSRRWLEAAPGVRHLW
jgi:hypothetical protein